jgi:hypothetical protein
VWEVVLEQGNALVLGAFGAAVAGDGIDGMESAVLDGPAMSARFAQPVLLVN